jgi:predicted ATPase/DNA-binding CsgD family transcriptional regulator
MRACVVVWASQIHLDRLSPTDVQNLDRELCTSCYQSLKPLSGNKVTKVPIASAPGPPHTWPMVSLPVQLTSFVGRASAIEMVRRRLKEERLVSLVGPGGCGKTRLAIEVARQAMGPQDCVVFVDFSGLSDPALVPGAVIRALGLREVPGQDPLETLLSQLSERALLLILDNCEHLIAACAAVAGTLARSCPGARLLATSRERLGVSGEAVVMVGGLELRAEADAHDDGGVVRSEAASLFIDRARLARADFVVDDPDALAVICQRLDGIPLALELAAARARLMSLGAIADGLSDRFHFLVTSERFGPARHKTLLASIEWSCDLLGVDERSLLHRLSVFASGFTIAAAKALALATDIEPREVLGLLTSLVDKSLVQALPGTDRFRLHETMRAYALAALEADGISEQVRHRHLGYFTALAKEMAPKTWTSEFPVALAALRPDLDNLRAALDWAMESQQFEAAAELLTSAANFLEFIGIYSEGLARCRRLLDVELEPLQRADLLYWASTFTRASDPAASLTFASDLTGLGRLLGDDSVLARGLVRAAIIQSFAKPDEGQKLAEEAARLAQLTGQHNMVVKSLQFEAWAYCWLGRPNAAFPLAVEAVEIAQQFDLLWEEGCGRLAVSQSARLLGRFERSLEEAKIVLGLSAELPGLFAYSGEYHSGDTYMYLGDPRARDALARARCEAEAVGHYVHAADVQCGQGHLLLSLGQLEDAYNVLEAGVTRLEGLGSLRLPSMYSLAVLAEIAVWRGDLALARYHLKVATGRVPNRTGPEVVPLFRAEARLARAEGRYRRAHALACDGLEAAFSGGHVPRVVDLLELTAITLADVGHAVDAARLVGAADHQREITKYVRWAPARDELAPVLANLEEACGKDPFEQALSEGRRLKLEEAIAYALRGRGSRSRAVSGWDSLTPSERRVAYLASQRLSNAEISDRLFVSSATVKSHLNRVFSKLGVGSRAQLVAAHFPEPPPES